MDYPIVYDKFETDFSGTGLAVLGNATNIKIKEVINGEFLLSFVLPRTDVSWQYVQPENFVKVFDCSQNKDQLFRIRAFDEIRDSTGKLTSNIQCEHVYYDAHDCKFFPYVELIGQTPEQILTYAFSGTRFTIGTVEITTKTDIFLDKAYPSEIVAKLIENVGGELIKDNWTISLVKKRGSNTGVEFRYGKNQATLKRETDAKNVITRLYPFGKDGLQIEGSLGYIDSPLINNYDRPRIGYIDYKDIEDPADLLAEALKEWSTTERDGIDKPKVTYSGEFVELKKLQEYGDVEAFALGDIVRIIDEGIEADTTQRIMEYEYYPYEPKRSTVVLSNLNPRVYRNSRPSNVIADTISQGQYVSDMQTSRGDINSGWLDNIREKLQTEINGMVQTALMHAQSDMYVDNIDNPNKALILGPGLFAIANKKKPNGDWDWRTIANGDRVVADEVDADWVYAGSISADQITSGEIIADGVTAEALEVIKANIDVVVSNTIITQNLYSQLGRVADLTVNELDTSYKKITNYLTGDTSPVYYKRDYEQYSLYIQADTDGLESEQYTSKDGTPLYWVDEEHEEMTTEVTAYPVMVYKYTEHTKMELSFRDVNGDIRPRIILGAGFGNEIFPERGKFIIDKMTDGGILSYTTADGTEYSIEIGENGIIQNGEEKLTALNFFANGFSADYNSTTVSYRWEKDVDGRITQLEDLYTGEIVPVTWGGGSL